MSSFIYEGIAQYFRSFKSFNRQARLYLTHVFLWGLSAGIILVLFNLYLLELGYQEKFLGLVEFLTVITAAFPAFLAGELINYLGYRLLLLIGTILSIGSRIGQITLVSAPAILTFSVILGASGAIFFVVGWPFMAAVSGKKERTHLFSFQVATLLLSGVFGSLLGGYLPKLFSLFLTSQGNLLPLRFSLMVAAGFLAFSLLPLLGIKNPPKKEKDFSPAFDGASPTPSKTLKKLLFTQIFVALSAGLIYPFFNVFFKNRLASTTAQIGTLFSLSSVFTGLSVLLAPLLVKRYGKERAIYYTTLLALPFAYAMLHSNFWVVSIAFLLRGALGNMSWPIFAPFSMELFSSEKRGRVSGLLNMVWNFGWGGGAGLAGWLMASFSYSYPYYLYLLFSLIFALSFRHFFMRPASS